MDKMVKLISKTKFGKEIINNPHGVTIRTLDNLLEASISMGIQEQVKDMIMKKHNWVMK